MDDTVEVPPVPDLPRRPRWAVWAILIGVAISMAAVAGLLFLPDQPSQADLVATQTANLALHLPFPTPTPALNAAIQRLLVAPAVETLAAGPDILPTAVGPAPQPSQPARATAAPQPTQVPQAPPASPPAIQWTQAEKYALSWLCWYEIRGMGVNKISACLSVISTIRVRYAYNSGFGVHDVISAINAPGQFTGVKIDTTRPSPDPDLLAAVEQYQAGARGACNGYPYFDSMPGGPMTCVIYGPGGQWEEFHNGR